MSTTSINLAPDRTIRRRLHGWSVLRYSRWDALAVGLSLVHGLVLIAMPWVVVIALGLCWNSNSVSHWFLHKPFFRGRFLNRLFSCYLSVLLGIPQALWRQRHLAHHADAVWRLRLCPQLAVETLLVAGLWASLWAWGPTFFWATYLPGYAAGLGLCWLQGHYEHARGTVSHYGWLYNRLFLNDGYHVEHHAHPGRHWTQLPRPPLLPRRVPRDGAVSRWPAVLRWLELFSLEGLERLVLCSRPLQRWMLFTHERALRRLLPEIDKPSGQTIRRVGIVGGGLFPRTALVLRRLLPDAQLAVIDRSAANLACACRFLGPEVQVVHETFDPLKHGGFDLLVFPLAYIGNREDLYQMPTNSAVLIHDWLWRRRGRSVVVSWWLLKRLNLVLEVAPTQRERSA